MLCLGLTACSGDSGERPVATTVSTTFDVGVGPLPDVASDPMTGKACVTSSADDSLYVLDTQYPRRHNVGRRHRIRHHHRNDRGRHGPDGIEVDSDTQTVYVANSQDDSVSIIDAKNRKTTATITVGDSPDEMAVDPESHLLYVANRGAGSITVHKPVRRIR